MREKQFQVTGLIGFIISGVFFIASGIKNTDILTVLGSLAWIGACVVWLIPLFSPDEKAKEVELRKKPHAKKE